MGMQEALRELVQEKIDAAIEKQKREVTIAEQILKATVKDLATLQFETLVRGLHLGEFSKQPHATDEHVLAEIQTWEVMHKADIPPLEKAIEDALSTLGSLEDLRVVVAPKSDFVV